MRYVPRFGPRGGGIGGVSSLGILVDGRPTQFRFPSLAPRVERGLPWSLPRPFCLSPGFSFPVDPYRTGEFLLAVSVTPRQSLAAVLHTLRHFSFEGREERNFRHRVFPFMLGSKKKRNCVRQARARSISHTSTHIFIAAV